MIYKGFRKKQCNRDAISVFAWRNRVKQIKTLFRTGGIPAEIRTENLMRQDLYSNLLGYVRPCSLLYPHQALWRNLLPPFSE
jgi:hypothetical protein